MTASGMRAIGLRTQFAGANVSVKARASRTTPAFAAPQAIFKNKKTAEKPSKKAAVPEVRSDISVFIVSPVTCALLSSSYLHMINTINSLFS